jgi:hypothetical protein
MRRYPTRRRWRRKKKKEVKKRMLRMRDKELFLWDLNEILKSVPDQSRAEMIAASIYSKASRLGIEDAVEYNEQMLAEKALDEETANKIHDLLMRNSTRR